MGGFPIAVKDELEHNPQFMEKIFSTFTLNLHMQRAETAQISPYFPRSSMSIYMHTYKHSCAYKAVTKSQEFLYS